MNQLIFGFYLAIVVCLFLAYKNIPDNRYETANNRTATELAEISK